MTNIGFVATNTRPVDDEYRPERTSVGPIDYQYGACRDKFRPLGPIWGLKGLLWDLKGPLWSLEGLIWGPQITNMGLSGTNMGI